MKNETLLGATSSKFRCVRCRGIYRNQAKLIAHRCGDKLAFGTLAVFIAAGQLSVGDAAAMRAPLATKGKPKAAVASV